MTRYCGEFKYFYLKCDLDQIFDSGIFQDEKLKEMFKDRFPNINIYRQFHNQRIDTKTFLFEKDDVQRRPLSFEKSVGFINDFNKFVVELFCGKDVKEFISLDQAKTLLDSISQRNLSIFDGKDFQHRLFKNMVRRRKNPGSSLSASESSQLSESEKYSQVDWV